MIESDQANFKTPRLGFLPYFLFLIWNKALGLDDDLARSSLRFGLGRFTTDEQIDYTIEAIKNAVVKLREISPLWEMFKAAIDVNSMESTLH